MNKAQAAFFPVHGRGRQILLLNAAQYRRAQAHTDFATWGTVIDDPPPLADGQDDDDDGAHGLRHGRQKRICIWTPVMTGEGSFEAEYTKFMLDYSAEDCLHDDRWLSTEQQSCLIDVEPPDLVTKLSQVFPVHQLPSDQRLLEFIDSVSATIKARSKEGVDAGVVPRSRGIDISGTWLH
jgi:hypothetical protein